MRWCRVRIGSESFYGRIDDQCVIRIDGAPFAEYSEKKESFGLDEVEWLPPVSPPTF